jgi:hypothetical protein
MAKKKTPAGKPCEECGGVECGTACPGVLPGLHARHVREAGR